MKKLLLGVLVVISFIALSFTVKKQKVEYKTITVVESIIPSGVGRSRMISAEEVKNYRDYTSTRSDDKKKDKRNKSSRSDIRVKNFEETKLLNFFNLGGIRFQNIAANDALVDSKINAMSEEGWELAFVNSGVESYGGKGDTNGIYVTRYVFRRSN